MEKILFLCYSKCSTCQKAQKWLKENNIEFESRAIAEQNPTKEELTEWVKKSGLPVTKFFNTSGKLYKEQNIKDFAKTATDDQLLSLLATNGMLVKRPVIVTSNKVLVGFKENEWSEMLKK